MPPIKYDRSQGRNATALMASTFVLIGGLIVCVLISVGFSSDPKVPLTLVGVYLFLVVSLMWLSRERRLKKDPHAQAYFWQKQDERADSMPRYSAIQRRQQLRETRAMGGNQPPTADRVRSLRDGQSTWVPSERNMPDDLAEPTDR